MHYMHLDAYGAFDSFSKNKKRLKKLKKQEIQDILLKADQIMLAFDMIWLMEIFKIQLKNSC